MVMTFTAVATGHNSAPHGRDPNRGIRGRSLILNDSHQDPIFQLQTDDTDVWFCLKSGATLQWVGNLTITGNLKVTGLVDFDSTGLAIDVDIEGDVDIAGGLDVITADAVNLQPSLSSQFTLSINTASDRTLTLACDAAAGSNNARNINITAANAGAGTATITLAGKTEIQFDTAVFDVNATGAVTVDGSTTMAFTTGTTLDFSATGGKTTWTCTGREWELNGATLDINLTADADINAATTMLLTAGTTFDINAIGGKNTWTATGREIEFNCATVDVNASADIDIAAGSTLAISAATTFTISTTGGKTTWTATGREIEIAAADWDLDTTATIDINAGSSMLLTATTTFGITATGGKFTYTGTGQEIEFNCTTIDFNAAADIDIAAGSTMALGSTTTFGITAGSTLTFTATSGATAFTCTGQAFTVDGASISLDATGGDCNFTNTSNAATDYTLSLINTGNSANFRNVTITAANAGAGVALLTLTGKTMAINSSTLITTTTGAVTFTHSGGAWTVNSTSQNIALNTLVGGDIDINSVADLGLDGATVHLNSSGQMDVVSGAALNITGVATTLTTTGAFLNTHSGGAWTVNSTSQNITLNTLVGGDINVNAVADLDLDGATFQANSSGQMDIVAGNALNVTTSAGLATFTMTAGLTQTITGAYIMDSTTAHIHPSGAGEFITGAAMTLTAGTTLAVNTTGGKTTWTATAQEIEIAAADIDIDTTATINILAGTTLTFVATAGITTFTATGQEIQMDCLTLDLNPTGAYTNDPNSYHMQSATTAEWIAGTTVQLTSGTTFGLTAGTTLTITATGGKTTWTCTGQEIEMNCADIDLNPTASLTLNAGTSIALVSTTTFGITAGDTITILAAGELIDIDSADLDIDTTATIALTAGTTLALAATGNLTLQGVIFTGTAGKTLTVSETSTIDSNYAAHVHTNTAGTMPLQASGVIGAGNTRYLYPNNETWNVAETFPAVMPFAGTVATLQIRVGTAPGAGETVDFYVMKNGAQQTMTVQIAGAGTTGSSSVNPVSFVAGDTISVQAIASNNGGQVCANGQANLQLTATTTVHT